MRTTSRPHPPAATLALAAAAALGLAGCVDRTVGPRATPASLALALDAGVAAAVPNGSVAIDLFYRRGGAGTAATQVSLLSVRLRSDSLGGTVPASFTSQCAQQVLAGQPASCAVSVPLQIDLTGCLADAQRTPAGPGCPIMATLVLRDAAMKIVAQATVGPVQAIPGRPITMPEVVLPLRTP